MEEGGATSGSCTSVRKESSEKISFKLYFALGNWLVHSIGEIKRPQNGEKGSDNEPRVILERVERHGLQIVLHCVSQESQRRNSGLWWSPPKLNGSEGLIEGYERMPLDKRQSQIAILSFRKPFLSIPLPRPFTLYFTLARCLLYQYKRCLCTEICFAVTDLYQVLFVNQELALILRDFSFSFSW